MLSIADITGYLAALMVIYSFTIHKNIRKLRLVNTIGCALFVIHGYLIDSYPVIITNVIIICINVYYLYTDAVKESE